MAWTLPASRSTPTNLGVQDGRLKDCPNTPNCVSSQASRPKQRVAPIPYTDRKVDAMSRVLALLKGNDKAEIITQRDDYIHATFQAWIFKDDVEFYFPTDEKVIHIRSASRVGKSDLNANLRRVKAISTSLTSTL